MKNQFLEAGQIVNTHGIQGEVKIVPWCDSPEFLLQFGTLYLDGTPVRVRAARVHKGNVLAALEGVADVNAAMALKGKIVSIDRSGVCCPRGGTLSPICSAWRSWTPAAGRSWGLWPTCSPRPPTRSTW